MAIDAVVVEHKTTSEDIGAGGNYWKRLTLDGQVSSYFVGARALGFEPVKALYDVIRKPSFKPLKATAEEDRKWTKPTKQDPVARLYKGQRLEDETPEQFRERLQTDIAEGPDKYYRRAVIVRLDEEETDAARDTWTYARLIEDAQALNRWPRNVDACQSYGSMCDYWPVCSGETSLADPTRYTRERAHEELASTKRRLPLVTASSLRCFRACPRRYQYRYELGFRAIASREALRFGSLFHTGLEVWWTSVSLDAAIAAIRSAANDPKSEVNPFQVVTAEELMRGYHLRWQDEPLEVLAVEAEFEAPLVNPDTGATSSTFARGGKIDAIVAA